ncbi:phosphotransferase enzyme family protein [Shewanella marina]|uniref:phosphotransferase enzyme family protein n=1 Tax=Shewanella marina TaxID=487319 RepID=UPI00046EFFF9|nr:aminoglycoside phosphotransferase family protein [Shewanella marina]
MNNFVKQQVLPYFAVSIDASVTPLGNGHINDTFLVRDQDTEFVLQRINTQVFTTPDALIANADKVSQHLTQKRTQSLYQLQVVAPIAASTGELAVDLGEQGYWRAISYLDHSHSVEVIESEQQAEKAAKAFGHFANALSDLDATQLEDVITKFHYLPGRIEALKQAAAIDMYGRLGECQQWFDLVLAQTELLTELADIEAKLPLRTCHNDTKINNMLFDKRDMSSLAIIDLDTCMKGHLMYDFGDMVRTFTSPEAEDSTNLANVEVREAIFAAICRGYLAELGQTLTELERQSLWLGAKVMCLMIGVRFLTDHLDGDKYFNIHHPGHNLERAANQFTLFQSLLAQQAQLISYLK